MSNLPPKPEEEEISLPERPPSPPLYTSFNARGIHVRKLNIPAFSSLYLISVNMQIGTDFFCLQTTRLQVPKPASHDPRRVELRWKKARGCRHRQSVKSLDP